MAVDRAIISFTYWNLEDDPRSTVGSGDPRIDASGNMTRVVSHGIPSWNLRRRARMTPSPRAPAPSDIAGGTGVDRGGCVSNHGTHQPPTEVDV